MGTTVNLDQLWTDRILNSIKGLEYGSVHIIVHDGRIVQIERTERKRFDTTTAKNSNVGDANRGNEASFG